MNELRDRFSVFIRFCTVGVGNTMIDFSFFFLFVKMGTPYIPAQIIAYSAGVTNSFIWNRFWTFKQRQKICIWEIIRFILINLIALATTNLLLIYLYEVREIALILSKSAATVGGILITFIGSRFWVFQKKATAS